MINKSNIIDYIILLNLTFRNKNIYFHKIFYKEFSKYLIPYIDIKINNSYYEYLKYDEFITKYNIKNKLLNIFKNINYIKIFIYFDNIDQNKIIVFKIKFLYKIIFNFEKKVFEFNIPLKSLISLKNIELKYNSFNINMIELWNNNYGIIIMDY